MPFRNCWRYGRLEACASSARSVWLPLITVLLHFSTLIADAQTNPPSVSYVRSYTNDAPDHPLVTLSVYGASNVACLTVEETIPNQATVEDVSGNGVWVPELHSIRWGPYFNTVSVSMTYRLTGTPGSYPVSGELWMDGQWRVALDETIVPVLSVGSTNPPPPPAVVATPSFTPPSGASVPTNVTISCATTGAVVYYTLDGSLPTPASTHYTGTVSLASAAVVRARAFTNGWTPSVAGVAYYGPHATLAVAQVNRSVDTNSLTIAFNVTPQANTACFTLEETLPWGLSASNVTAGGSHVVSNNSVRWGPYFGTNALTLSYQAVGPPGRYHLRTEWSVDGLNSDGVETNIVIAGRVDPPPPPLQQVAPPVFNPASGSNVPVSVTITDSTPGAAIYYTLDGSLPTLTSAPYTGAVQLVSASVLRARAFTNGWQPSVVSVAYYGLPAAQANVQVTRIVNTDSTMSPMVTLSATPGVGTTCIAVTEWLPAGVGAINVSAGGSYVASNNAVLWGPFFGGTVPELSYRIVGPSGIYPVRATWSVDGVGDGEAAGADLVIAISGGGGPPPPPPQQTPMPMLTPSFASSLPVTVSISSSDPLAQIFFTTDGTLPTLRSTPYTGPLTFTRQTALRARAVRSGYLPSVAALGEYVPAVTISTVAVIRGVSGDGSFLPTITLTAMPHDAVSCYSVTETIAFGLMPTGLSGDAFWDPLLNTIRWGPYLDHEPRTFAYNLGGPSGTFPLAGEGSFDGYPVAITGASAVQVNANYIGSPPTNIANCATKNLIYTVQIDPSPGVVTVTSATGTVAWGDGTQSAITEPVMTFEKLYGTAGTYSVVISADWTGFTATGPVSSHASRTDTVQVVTACVVPEIVTQPSDQFSLAGGTAQFSVSAASPFPISYQWYFNQTTPISSPSSQNTLTLPNVKVESAGLYSVVVANAFGSVTSSVARLTVVVPLVIGLTQNGNGSVTLQFVGQSNSAVTVWAATRLSPSDWMAVYMTNAGPTGMFSFTDTNAPAFPVRFYRFSTP